MKIKISHVTRVSLLLAIFFCIDKVLGAIRQIVIARQFGLSSDLDVFNVANNLPDMLFALISGGALAMAFIPILSEVLTKDGRSDAWDLFSRIANLAFLITSALAILIAILSGPLVRWELGVAPGLQQYQQDLVVDLMRLNLIATLIFSISGLVMAGLQANQHFLLPALAPLLYDIGQIFGALILSPEKGYSLGSITLPAFGLGIHGLVYGVILGSILHLGIQVPGLLAYQFRWKAGIGLKSPNVQKVLRILVPRLGTMLIIQLIFIIRDNLASRLAVGSVTALTYGWLIQQVPETLIGTAIGTAILPTLAEQITGKENQAFQKTIERATQVILAITIPCTVIIGLGLRPILSFAFGFDAQGTDMLLWVSWGFLIGLTGHSLLEVVSRSFYAQQDAITPLVSGILNLTLYIILGSCLYRTLGVVGISLTDSIAFTLQTLLLFILLNRRLISHISVRTTLFRALLGGIIGGIVVYVISLLSANSTSPLIFGIGGMIAGSALAMPFIWREMRLLVNL